MFPKSLKNMLLLSVATLVGVTGIAVSQLVVHRYSVSLLAAASARAENSAHKLALEAADKILVNDRIALQKMLEDQMHSDPTVAYLFIVRQDTLLTHTFADGFPVGLIQANHVSDGDSGHLQKIISQDGERYLDIAFPIFDGKAGTLRMGISEAPYRRQVRNLWLQMSLITLGILAVSILISHWMIQHLTRPLRQLTRYAEQIDEGNLDLKVQIKGRLEATKLASAFNSMLARLQDYTLQLKDSNARLERKNSELDRTHNQLKTAFSISQKIAALPRLEQICQFLIETLKAHVECRNMSLLVFNHASRTINLATPYQIQSLSPEFYDPIFEALNRHSQLAFIQQPDITGLHLPEPLNAVEQIAVFPIRHLDLMLGAMLVACAGTCQCIRTELGIVMMILHQAAGAIHRANLHEEELRELRQRVEAESGFGGIVGKDPKMQAVFKLIEDVAPTDATVLIHGESGTGKELVARLIHDRSQRAQQPFVVINCAAYPSTLLESELFGYEKGAFTGALRRKIGRFEQADGGTVFLDEIGEIDPTAQIKLLRVIQQQTLDRLGGGQPIKVNVRILAATHQNLLAAVQKGEFREDLFYRLNVIPIKLPPLRERPRDIHLLARHFLNWFAKEQGKSITGFHHEAMRCLLNNPWPGNVRELENSIEHAVVLAKSNRIELKDLPPTLVEPSPSASEVARSITQSEEKLIREALQACDWNKTEAARQLGISRSTLYEKMKRFRIIPPTLH